MRRLGMPRVVQIIVALMLVSVPVGAEDFVDLVRQGNYAYRSNDYDKALEYYHRAETQLPESPELEYNMGAALHQRESYEEAVERYTRALNTQDIQQEARAHYNLGNTYFRMGEYQKAIESYQNTLEINPEDVDAKYNLELARRKLKEQLESQQQQPQQQQKQQQQDQQPQEQEQDQQQGQQPPDDQRQQEQQQQQQGDEEQEQQEQQTEPGEDQEKEQPQDRPQTQEQEISREEARRILDALRDDEEQIQKQVQRRQVQSSGYSGKDW